MSSAGWSTTVNRVTGRLESSFGNSNDLSLMHRELRTPLAILRAEPTSLSNSRSPDVYRQSLELIKDEAERLSRIVRPVYSGAAALDCRHEKSPTERDGQDCVRAANVLAALGG
jgi:signal transduction histidine kinase